MLEYLKSHHKEGFTLVELVIAIVIIALAMTGVITFFPTSRRATEDSALKNRIANSIVSKVEELKGVGYKKLIDLAGVTLTTSSIPLDDTLNIAAWKTELEKIASNPVGTIEIRKVYDNLLSVRVNVTWGDNKSYEIFTYIAP
jgi:prepilin-type N-terminal cleavage/methylation domain-containing protein